MTKAPITRLLTAVLWTGVLAAATILSAVDIVKDGKPNARIVIAEKPTRTQWLAAFELRDYVKKISGAELSIVNEPLDAKSSASAAIDVYVGDSRGARSKGVTSKGLDYDAYRMVSGKNWLALFGNDANFKPIEPWGRNHGHGQKKVIPEWDAMTGAKWRNAMATSVYKNYSGKAAHFEKDQEITPTKSEDVQFWRFDKKGSLNAVYAFLRNLGVRWYMPGDLGEVVPKMKTIALPKIDETVHPDVKSRSMSWDRYGGITHDHIMWSLRLGLNHMFAPMHHGIASVITREEQRKLHPEFYSVLSNGKRDLEARRPQTCLSCPGLLKENVEYVKANYDIYDVPIVSVMPQDGFGKICQCENCRDKVALEQGDRGRYSNYVWNYVNKVAKEVAKTHPDRKIICGAYSTYQEPPNKIDKLEPNVLVSVTNGRPRTEMDPEIHKKLDEMRRTWLEKSQNPLTISINHHLGYLPFFVPHVIAKGLKDEKGQVWREDLWFMPFSREGLYKSAINHLGVYVAARLWWDQDRDVDEILDEYYDLFYGPAKADMKAFVEYVEANYGDLTKDSDKVNKAFELFDAVKKKVDPETVYGKRVAKIDEALATWRKRRDQLAKGRENAPEYNDVLNYDKKQERYLKPRTTFVFDGKLDEPFWTVRSRGKALKLIGGRKPKHKTTFLTRWYQNHLYLGIRCDEDMASPLNVTATERDDPAILDGDHVRVLLETASHAYYQIAVNPAGALLDRDLGVEEAGWNRWDSQAEVKIHKGDGFWSAEMRIPVTESDNDPLHQVIGKPPSASMPWFFNVGRQRGGGDDVELSSFMSVKEKGEIDDPKRFAKMMLRGTNKKARRARKLAKQKALKEQTEKEEEIDKME